jgi:hypothetical protein
MAAYNTKPDISTVFFRRILGLDFCFFSVVWSRRKLAVLKPF